MSDLTPETILRYLEARKDQRTKERTDVLAALSKREAALLKEVAAMAYVQGRMAAQGPHLIPRDMSILDDAISGCLAMSDLYPTVSRVQRLGRRRQQRQGSTP